MPILIDELSVWDISFRWAGYDPRKFYFRIPLAVEDHARNLINAIHKAEISCMTISLEKRDYSKEEEKFSFYYWVDDFFSTTSGAFVNRRLLKWALISRYDLMQWCKRMNAPLPEFWFPQGWSLEYQLSEGEIKPGHGYRIRDWLPEQIEAYLEEFGGDESQEENSSISQANLRRNQKVRIACMQTAEIIWKKDPTRTIASVIKDEIIQIYCGASHYDDETVRGWINSLAPDAIRNHRGRPKKKKD
jgi:hypothetical protein